MKFRFFKKIVFSVLVFFIITQGFSQAMLPPEPPNDEDPDPEGAPINDFIIPMIILGITIGFVLQAKKQRQI